MREVGEGSNEAYVGSNGTTTDLVKVGMTSTNTSQCIASFRLLIGLLLVGVDVSEVYNTQASQFFIFSFRCMIQVGLYSLFFSFLLFMCFFFFYILMLDTWFLFFLDLF